MNSIHPDNKKKIEIFKQYVKFENQSYSEQNIKVGDNNFTLVPGESKNMTIMSNAVIKTDDSMLKLENDIINTIYITENGLFTNLKCGKGELFNDSNRTVIFVEVGHRGKWNKATLFPGKSSEAFISHNSKWEVVSSDRKTILGHVKTKGEMKIIYNGKNLFAK